MRGKDATRIGLCTLVLLGSIATVDADTLRLVNLDDPNGGVAGVQLDPTGETAPISFRLGIELSVNSAASGPVLIVVVFLDTDTANDAEILRVTNVDFQMDAWEAGVDRSGPPFITDGGTGDASILPESFPMILDGSLGSGVPSPPLSPIFGYHFLALDTGRGIGVAPGETAILEIITVEATTPGTTSLYFENPIVSDIQAAIDPGLVRRPTIFGAEGVNEIIGGTFNGVTEGPGNVLLLNGVHPDDDLPGIPGGGRSVGDDFFGGAFTVNVVPEPSTMLLMSFGALAALRRKKR